MEKLCNGCFKKYDDKFDLCPYCGYYPGAPAKEAYHLAPGTVIGDRYRLGNVIGFGGFGITYKAWDTQLDTLVAIKEYYPVGAVNRTPDSSKLISSPTEAGASLKWVSNGLSTRRGTWRSLIRIRTLSTSTGT